MRAIDKGSPKSCSPNVKAKKRGMTITIKKPEDGSSGADASAQAF